MAIVVAFISQKGGVGKSTLARALGAVAAHAGLKVMIADLDPQQATVLRWEKTREENNVAPSLSVRGFKTVEEALEGVDDSELVILDTPSRTNRTTLEIARHAHLVVQPSGPSVDDLHPSVLLFHELVQAGVPRERLVLALCRTLSGGEETTARAYLKAAGYSVLPGSIPERAAYREAQNRGQALTETKQKVLNERADALMAELITKVTVAVEALQKHGASHKNKGGREVA